MNAPVNPKVIGDHIRRLRSDRRLSARAFAAQTGFSPSLGPGGKSGKHPHAPSREEFVFIVKGQVTLTLADEENAMRPGDAVTLPAQAPRLWENRTRELAEILIVSSRMPNWSEDGTCPSPPIKSSSSCKQFRVSTLTQSDGSPYDAHSWDQACSGSDRSPRTSSCPRR